MIIIENLQKDMAILLKIFDIINREYIIGTGEELLEFYQFEFLNERQIKTL